MATFAQFAPDFGMDEAAQWLMVPKGGFNLAMLRDGQGLELKCSGAQCIDFADLNSNSAAAKKILANLSVKSFNDAFGPIMSMLFTFVIPSSARVIVVVGNQPGNTVLNATDKKTGRVQTSLAVTVLKPKSVNVTFNFVRHQKDANTVLNHYTSSSPADLPKWVDSLNRVFTPQANIVFKANAPGTPVVQKYLDAVLTDVDLPDIVKERDSNAGWNVFIVGKWEYQKRITGSARTGTTIKDLKLNVIDSICDDEARGASQDPIEVVIAHEAVHALSDMTIAHPAGRSHPEWLAQTDQIRTGRKLPKEHVKVLNPF